MAILGPYTGDPDKPVSYLYGPHFKALKGYRVIQGNDSYNHFFGGCNWNLPVCPACKEPMHQLFTFDLRDPRLFEICSGQFEELPLVTCLNCSYTWETQYFFLDFTNKMIKVHHREDKHGFIMDEEDRFPVPLPRVQMKLIEMLDADTPTDYETYCKAFDYLGKDYICRLLGAPLLQQFHLDRECPICKKEMKYVATVGCENYGNEKQLIEGIDFLIGEYSLYFLLCTECSLLKVDTQGT